MKMKILCKNCSTILVGKFCHQCSQKDTDIPTFFTFLSDSLRDILEFDFRIFRSIKVLIFNPGLITLHYWKGKYVSYTKPLRLLALVFLFVVLSGNLIDSITETKAENIAKLQKYLSFFLLPLHAFIFKVLYLSKKELHYTHFFIFSIHLTAATGLVGGLAVFISILDPNYGTIEANQIVGNLAMAIPVILQFFWMLNVFQEKIFKTIIKATIVSLSDFIISIIVVTPLMFFFPEDLGVGNMGMDASSWEKEIPGRIKKLNEEIDSLKSINPVDERKIDSLKQEIGRKKKFSAWMKNAQKKADELKSKTEILENF